MNVLDTLHEIYIEIVNLWWRGSVVDAVFSDLVIAAFGGGLVVKFLDIFYLEIRRLFDKKQSAKLFIDQHLDPFLKSSDEVVGKLCALARKDFISMKNIKGNLNENNDYISLYYLLAKFWAEIEIIRREGLSVSIVKDKRGRQYQTFINCLQSKNVRLIDRITQRAIGEMLLKDRNGKLETISFIEFFSLLENNDSIIEKWGQEISQILSKATHTKERQKLLKYGIVMHAMIDTLDGKYSNLN